MMKDLLALDEEAIHHVDPHKTAKIGIRHGETGAEAAIAQSN
jgi:hypothetical protein